MRPLLFVRSVVFAFVFVSLPGSISAADPVKDLQQILWQRPGFSNKERMADYQKKLDKQVQAIQRLGDLRRALMLEELREDFIMQLRQQPGNPADEENPLGKVYQKVRSDLETRLQGMLRGALGAKDSARRLAAIVFLAEMARDESKRDSRNRVTFPGVEQRPAHRFTSRLAAEVREVVSKDREPRVRAAAAGALAAIAPGAKQTLEELEALLKPNREVVERRAAAKALRRLSESLLKPFLDDGESRASAEARRAIVTAAGLGLRDDKDATVRLRCLEAIHQALQQSFQAFQPHKVSRPLVAAVRDQTPAVIALLEDGDLKVSLAAHQVLETTAAARRILRAIPLGREEERFQPPPEKRPAEEAKLLDGLLKALPALKRSLVNKKEVRVRGVRCAFLNNMAPQQADKAVPALAEALKDNNKTVRLSAAQALRRYGPQAKTAVNPLTQTVEDSEPQVRMAAINALAAIGSEARPAAAAVVKVLANPKQKPDVRTAAARALGQFGGLNAEAKKALKESLDDEDSDTSLRQAASETLLEKKES